MLLSYRAGLGKPSACRRDVTEDREVRPSPSGTRHLYAVRADGLAVGRAFFEQFWSERLQALKRAAEAAGGESSSGG